MSQVKQIFISLILASSLYVSCLAEVTILSGTQVIYDQTQKLRIRATGFSGVNVNANDIKLDLGPTGVTLRADKDYLITKDEDDGLILKLLSNRRWVGLNNREPRVGLMLRSVKLSEDGKEQLVQPILVAQVIPTPDVFPDTREIHHSATKALYIKGTGFVGAKKVDLYFSPPLLKEIAYEIVSPFPLVDNLLHLRIRAGYKWSETLGPLKVLGVDTGGGPVKINGDEGVVVATVGSDLDRKSSSATAASSSTNTAAPLIGKQSTEPQEPLHALAALPHSTSTSSSSSSPNSTQTTAVAADDDYSELQRDIAHASFQFLPQETKDLMIAALNEIMRAKYGNRLQSARSKN